MAGMPVSGSHSTPKLFSRVRSGRHPRHRQDPVGGDVRWRSPRLRPRSSRRRRPWSTWVTRERQWMGISPVGEPVVDVGPNPRLDPTGRTRRRSAPCAPGPRCGAGPGPSRQRSSAAHDDHVLVVVPVRLLVVMDDVGRVAAGRRNPPATPAGWARLNPPVAITTACVRREAVGTVRAAPGRVLRVWIRNQRRAASPGEPSSRSTAVASSYCRTAKPWRRTTWR